MKAAFNKILHRKKKPKTLSTGPGLNQSMINIIVNDNEHSESFHSHQPDLVRSPTMGIDFDDFSDRGDPNLNSPERVRIRGNISSVLNVPKKRSIISDLYEIFHDHVIEQLGEMMSSKKGAVEKVEIPKVELSDFQDYIEKLKHVHSLYKKRNARRLKQIKEIKQTDIKGSLVKCFEKVPSQYFDEEFLFNFEYLTSDKAKITHVQEDLVNYLDFVEANLHLQLTTRFQEFVDVILKLSQMDAQIQSSLFIARFYRNMNNELRIKCSDEVKNVLKVRRKKNNIEKVAQLLNVVSSVRKTIPSLVQLVEKNNLQGAINLIKSSEEIYQNQLTGIKIVKHFNIDFNDAKKTLEKLVTDKVEDKCFAYLSQALSYTKKSQLMHFPEVSFVEESFMNVSTIDGSAIFDDEPSSHLSLNWTVNAFQRNEQIEENQANTIVEYNKFKVFPMKKYQDKLTDLFNNFHNKFFLDMEEHSNSLTANKAVPMQEGSLFDLHIKFVLFYFNLAKRLIQTQLWLSHKILNRLINYLNLNWNKFSGRMKIKEKNFLRMFKGPLKKYVQHLL